MKTKQVCMMLLIVAGTSVAIISCKKQETVITNEQDINFFKRDELLKDAFSKLNGTFSDETLLNKVITEFKDYDKTKHISQDIITKFGKPKWDISIVLKNTNGFRTIFTPIANEKNEVTSFAIFNQNSNNGFNYKIVDGKTSQTKLPVYGDKEGKIFTKATLLGLFDVSDKNLSSFYKTGINAQIQTNSVTNSVTITRICWPGPSWWSILPNGTPEVVVSNTQCVDIVEYDPNTYLTAAREEDLGGGGNGTTAPTPPIVNDCDMTEQDIKDALSNITCEVFSGAGNIKYEDGTLAIDNNGARRLARNSHFNFAKVRLLTTICGYTANFTGSIYKASDNSPWIWENFNYANTVHSSGAYPTCGKVETTTTCSTIIDTDKLTASADISFTYKATFSCTSGEISMLTPKTVYAQSGAIKASN